MVKPGSSANECCPLLAPALAPAGCSVGMVQSMPLVGGIWCLAGNWDVCSHACRLLATHDDYSMTARLPPGTKTFVTSLFRDPVDRVMSSYEFAAHIAARSMGLDVSNHPDDTVMSARKKIRDHYTNLVNTDTRNIWPWTVLSVAMEEDLWTRVS